MVDVSNPFYQEDLESTFSYMEELLGDKKSNILVVGATGLIGSFLVDAFISYSEKSGKEIQIYAMGRNYQRLERRFNYCKSNQLHLMEQDIQQQINTNQRYDFIFHLASNADPNTYKLFPYETITTNVLGTKNVIDYAIENRNTKVLFTSTMEVYGEIQKESLKEEYYGAIDFNQIRAGYPESKRTSELMYRSAVEEYGIHAVITRLGYIFGPTMTDGDNKIIAEFIRKKKTREEIILRSSGSQRRTYCYVADAVTGMLLVLAKGQNGQAYNVADENSKVTLRELAEIFGATTGSQAEEEKEVFDTVLEVTKIKKLGWGSRISIQEGINRTLKCMK